MVRHDYGGQLLFIMIGTILILYMLLFPSNTVCTSIVYENATKICENELIDVNNELVIANDRIDALKNVTSYKLDWASFLLIYVFGFLTGVGLMCISRNIEKKYKEANK